MGHTLEDWGISLAIAAAAFAAGKLLYRFTANVLRRWVTSSKSRLDDIVLDTLGGPAVVMVTLIGLYVAFARMGFTGKVDAIGMDAFHAAWTLSLTWLAARVVAGVLREYLLPYAKERIPGSMDDNVMSLSVRAASMIIWGMGLIAALNNVGYNVSALLAGIGISGLALAMAAKDTVANVFGGITVFADRPFRIGDRIRIDGYDGTVIHVGIRSTRIRTIEGPLVVDPELQVHRYRGGERERRARAPRAARAGPGVRHDTGADAARAGHPARHRGRAPAGTGAGARGHVRCLQGLGPEPGVRVPHPKGAGHRSGAHADQPGGAAALQRGRPFVRLPDADDHFDEIGGSHFGRLSVTSSQLSMTV
ncbi:MAG: mechanosensitive ion channel [Flavobacteriales bacterium]